MCWHHQSVWPKLHRHSNITSNHCSSFQTTLNSLVWSLWSNLSKRCLIGALRTAVWRAHTPHLSQHYTLVISQEKEKGGFPACGDNEMWSQAWTMQCLPCVLTIWPVIMVSHETITVSYHCLPVTQQHPAPVKSLSTARGTKRFVCFPFV